MRIEPNIKQIIKKQKEKHELLTFFLQPFMQQKTVNYMVILLPLWPEC